jgi:hypothetical protein
MPFAVTRKEYASGFTSNLVTEVPLLADMQRADSVVT